MGSEQHQHGQLGMSETPVAVVWGAEYSQHCVVMMPLEPTPRSKQVKPMHPNPSQSTPIHPNPSQSTPIHPNPSQSTPIHPVKPIDPNPPSQATQPPIVQQAAAELRGKEQRSAAGGWTVHHQCVNERGARGEGRGVTLP